MMSMQLHTSSSPDFQIGEPEGFTRQRLWKIVGGEKGNKVSQYFSLHRHRAAASGEKNS